ncbi:hypothetical protein F5B22DRAFT_612813 [Xylaria bambusicola]|uniref:uncharacterized protein n=1 Tax=Xylaria bambusicola TaxID=326684 RepID=UPI002008A4EE|nr:uncharacterized protein F5B22DRAFT_612813 [Xylaria bambusicola]KAI0512956.1 hypothetical protein F5B22DRAFT_612813 [Xylaria bambusicola]
MGRLRQIAAAVAALVVLVAVFLARTSQSTEDEFIPTPTIPGRNGTVLFIINTEYGLSNVHLATTSALLEKHPGIEVHVASFPQSASKVAKLSALAQKRYKVDRGVQFHELPGRYYAQALSNQMGGVGGKSVQHLLHPPGIKGIEEIMRVIRPAISPWDGTDHIEIYEKVRELIGTIDPALVVLDMAFRPAIDAAIRSDRLYTYLSPNVLADTFWFEQPLQTMITKIPRIGLDSPSPLPWQKIPENFYFTWRFIYGVIAAGDFNGTKAKLEAHGIKNSLHIKRPRDRPWMSQDMPGASIALDVMPPNVTSAGPIVFEAEPAIEHDPELVAWLAKAPTVLVNLGSLFIYSEHHATTMALALEEILAKTDVQVLWKMSYAEDVPDDYTLPAQNIIKQGRLRVTNWLTVTPASLLDTGHIVASVHHGGANCYHEAIAAGVPQVVLPAWLDCYNYAQLAEDIGVGVYANRHSAPYWTVDGLRDSFLRVLDGKEEGRQMKEKAERLGETARKDPGRYVVAREIARLAASGHA